VYQIGSGGSVLRVREKLLAGQRRLPSVHPNVLYLGLTSMFTDISSEMVSSVLPLYLVLALGFSPLQFGVVDGLYQGVTALLRIAGGVWADQTQRHKEVAEAGYGLSAISKVGLLLAGGAWTGVVGTILIDRLGKGIRTAPRDALIALSTPEAELGTAFGVHRALDTLGAMLGPLVAFGILALTPRRYDVVFVASFCLALIGLGVLTLFVENRKDASDTARSRLAWKRSLAVLRSAPQFAALTLVGTLLSVATISDAFLYLTLQQRLGFNAGWIPLLYVATALVYFLLAIPIGRLADQLGRRGVYLGGYVALLLVYFAAVLPAAGLWELGVILLFFGAYYAATDGVLMALASAHLSTEIRSGGLAVLTTATSLGALLASVIFGALWTWVGVAVTTRVFLGGLVLGIVVALAFLTRIISENPNADSSPT
jgi:MFS family permease